MPFRNENLGGRCACKCLTLMPYAMHMEKHSLASRHAPVFLQMVCNCHITEPSYILEPRLYGHCVTVQKCMKRLVGRRCSWLRRGTSKKFKTLWGLPLPPLVFFFFFMGGHGSSSFSFKTSLLSELLICGICDSSTFFVYFFSEAFTMV